VPPDQRDDVIRGVLDQIIGYRLLVQESQLRKITVPEATIDARVAELRAQFPSEEAFTQTLELRQMTRAMLRAEARQGLQVDAMLMAELSPTTSVTPEQVKEFYEQNPSEFQQGERVRASHILIGVPDNADAATKEQARVRALGVLGEVRVGTDFATLAKQYSDDTGSAANGGDLGYFERGQMVGPFEEVAFSLAPAQTSGLVESPFGYHIIRVIDRQASRTIPLDEMREQIQQFLEDQNRELQTQAFVEALRAKGKVDIYI
jgi:peptidyl-prolyl cis-trans isomerase C